MKNIIIRIIIGLAIGGGIAWAFTEICLQDITGNYVGTASNPLYITNN